MEKRKREAGILMPIFSLPGDYGIGSFGKEAREFVDLLSETGNRVWQVLPISLFPLLREIHTSLTWRVLQKKAYLQRRILI